MDNLLNPSTSGADPSFRNAMNNIVASNISSYVVGVILNNDNMKATAISKIKAELKKLYTKKMAFASGVHTLKDELLLMLRKQRQIDDITYQSLDISHVTFDFDVITNKVLANVKKLSDTKF